MKHAMMLSLMGTYWVFILWSRLVFWKGTWLTVSCFLTSDALSRPIRSRRSAYFVSVCPTSTVLFVVSTRYTILYTTTTYDTLYPTTYTRRYTTVDSTMWTTMYTKLDTIMTTTMPAVVHYELNRCTPPTSFFDPRQRSVQFRFECRYRGTEHARMLSLRRSIESLFYDRCGSSEKEHDSPIVSF